MGWPYEFIIISPEERHQRRLVLDSYGVYAQLLVLVPCAIGLAIRVSTWVSRVRHGSYDAVPDSPALKSQRLSARGAWASRVRRLQWWLGDDVVFMGQHWGQRDQWIFGTLWAAALTTLCVLETGKGELPFGSASYMSCLTQAC